MASPRGYMISDNFPPTPIRSAFADAALARVAPGASSRRQALRWALGTGVSLLGTGWPESSRGADAAGLDGPDAAHPDLRIPVLLYHRVAATAADSMTLRLQNFNDHLRVLQDCGCTVVPLADVLAWRTGQLQTLPPRPVALTADDGHRSVYEVMAPLLSQRGWPLTLFIYPSAISHASYAMTWAQLETLQDQGHCSIQSHTYWHPNLLHERQHRTPQDFDRFVAFQLGHAKSILEQRLHAHVSLLAWPFGLSDAQLWGQAAQFGYAAAFGLGARAISRTHPLYNLPRYLMVDAIGPQRLKSLLDAAHTVHGRS